MRMQCREDVKRARSSSTAWNKTDRCSFVDVRGKERKKATKARMEEVRMFLV